MNKFFARGKSIFPAFAGLGLSLILFGKCAPAFSANDISSRHNTLLSLDPEPVADLAVYKEARTYWLPDYVFALSGRSNDTEGNRFAQSCEAYGNYSSACPAPRISSRTDYFGELTCYLNCRCPDGFIAEADCALPKFTGGIQCDGKWEKCETDIDRACRGEINNFVPESDCPAGWQLAEKPRCPYDNNYGICCNKCEGYDYTDVSGGNPPPQGYVIDAAEKCSACSGLKYKKKINVCGDEFSLCTAYGPLSTAKKCYEGSTVKFDACKTCPHACTMSESECKSGGAYICSQEACSGDWCRTGCATGYSEFCELPVTDCAILGYAAGSCPGSFLKCPFNTTKMICF